MAFLLPPRARWQGRYGADLPEPPELEGLLEPGVDALPVRILVQQDDFVTGWDDGAMGFEDDARPDADQRALRRIARGGRVRQSPWRIKRPGFWALGAGTPNAEGLLETGDGAIPVRIGIVQDGVTTGWDDGALGFDEGAVWFSDRACSFRVVASDLAPAAGETRRLEDAFGLRHATRTVEVDVTVLDVEGRDVWQDEAFLDQGLVDLRRRPVPDGESEYPPLVPRPGLVYRQPVLGSYCIALFAAAQAWIHLTGASLLAVVTLAALLPLGLRAFFRHPDQTALRRIEREERSAFPADAPPPEFPRYRARAKKIRRRGL